jgi:hypothetical protein
MTKKINKQTWFKIEAIHRANYFMTVTVFRNYGKIISRLGGGDCFYYVMWIIEKGTAYLCYPRENFNKGVQYIFNKTINDPAWAESINKQVVKDADKYYKFSKKLENKNFVKYSNKLLVKTFQDLINIQDDSHTSGQITTWLVDADYQLFTNYLLELLTKRIDRSKKKINLAETFSLLTTPEKQSLVEQEALESLMIAFLLSQDKKAKKIFLENSSEEVIKKLNILNKALKRKIKTHYKKYFWLHYTYEGPILELDYFIQIWQGLIRENKIERLILEAKNRTKK